MSQGRTEVFAKNIDAPWCEDKDHKWTKQQKNI